MLADGEKDPATIVARDGAVLPARRRSPECCS